MAADGKQLCEIITSAAGARVLAVSADGSRVAAANPEGRLEAWSVADGKRQWSRTLASKAQSLHFSADGKTLVARCDGTERKVDPANGRNLPR